MLHQEIQKSSSWNSSSEANSFRFAPRPVTVQAQEHSHKAPTQQEMENEAFGQNKVEASELQLKGHSGAITSEEQERLGVLKAGMDDFWSQRLESASRFGYNFANIPIHSPGIQVPAPVQPQAPPIQAKSTVGQSNDTVEQKPDRVARQAAEMPASVEQRSNQTGLPNALKSGVEQLAGLSLDDVKVHYNSAKPAQLDALAYAQGRDIHVAPGQEKHLPHEAWHFVQQAQFRVQPTMQMKSGVPVNDDQGLEHEADEMGLKAMKTTSFAQRELREKSSTSVSESVIQGVFESWAAIQPAARLSAADAVVQRIVWPASTGTRKKPLFYSSLDPNKRTFENADMAEAYDRELEQQQAAPQPEVEVPGAVVPDAAGAGPAVAEVAHAAAEQADAPRTYPLGFASEQQFRDATRPLARQHRDAQIVVTGSSVTGRSGDGTRAFRPAGTRKVPGDKKSGPSDIDIGVVKPDSVGRGQVDSRGFPVRGTELASFEKKFGRGIEKATGGHPSGIKFFEGFPEEPRRGRSRTRRERPRIVRAHTPEGERQDEDAF